MTTFVTVSLFVAKYAWAVPFVYYGVKNLFGF